MAERAGLSRATIGKIEKGDPTASMGGYAVVLWVLGMDKQFAADQPHGYRNLSAITARFHNIIHYC